MSRIDELIGKLNDRSQDEAEALLFQWVKIGAVSLREFREITRRQTSRAVADAVMNVLTSRD